jgi:hypothetical protein
MAAGQGFKTFTTGEVLTAGDVNGYLMQGINVFATTTARDAAITAPAEGQFAFTKDTNSLWYYDGAAWVASGATGDIEGVTAGVGISGGGTSGTVTVTNSMATAIDAKGDLVPGTGADTFARLAVGANDTVLTADSTTATGLKWATPAAGGMTVIASGSLSSTSVSLTSIPQTYKDLQLRILNFEATLGSNMQIRINNDSGANKYAQNTASTDARERAYNQTNSAIAFNTDNSVNTGLVTLTIPNYTNATTSKIGFAYSMLNSGNNNATINTTYNIMVYKEVDAVTSLQMVFDGGTASAGTYILYGVS